jgi:hypothetical protein
MREKPHKLSFQEAWESTTPFFVDEELEKEIDKKVHELISCGKNDRVSEEARINIEDITDFLQEKESGLDVILKDIGLSDEKFQRIISLLRILSIIPEEFDNEWSIKKVKSLIKKDREFAKIVAKLLVDGIKNEKLKKVLPKYYLEKLNYREIKGISEERRRWKYKDSLIGKYGGRKGKTVEGKIAEELERIKSKYGVNYESGPSRIINTNIDFAIPTVDDPWIIIMVSFQETTSSGQSTKARDMFEAYNRIRSSNVRNREDRAFVNFVDGAGWMARKRDFQRLVEECHYFLNLKNLTMLEGIILKHVPKEYFKN